MQGILYRWWNLSRIPIACIAYSDSLVKMCFKLALLRFFHCPSMRPVPLGACMCESRNDLHVNPDFCWHMGRWTGACQHAPVSPAELVAVCSWSLNQAKFTADIWSTTKPFWRMFLSMWVLCGSHVHVGSFMNNWLKERRLRIPFGVTDGGVSTTESHNLPG